MTDIQERLEHYEAKDRERQEREAEIVRYDLQLLAYARTHATLGDDYYRQYALRNAMIWDYGKTYGTKAQERLKELLDDAREKFQARAQELAETAGIQEREDSDEERKELIKKIKRADLITVYLCIRHLGAMAGSKVSYRDGLIDAFRTVYGLDETNRLWEYLDKRRERMTRIINYMLRGKKGGAREP